MRTILIAMPALAFGIFLSCAGNGAPPKPPLQADSIKPAQPASSVAYPDNYFNNVSGVISGVSEEGNSLRHLFDTAAWKSNKSSMEHSWQRLKKQRLDPMRSWSDKELQKASASHVVFYPFSGPDYVTVDAFFPKARTVIMLGLEPVGALPKVEKFDSSDAREYCDDLRRSLTDIFEKSFFITQYMLRDFQKQQVNGTLPVLCFFLKRTGHQVLDIRYVVRRGDTLAEIPYTDPQKPFGVKIVCRADTMQRTVYYFKYDVANKNFNDSLPFYRFVRRQVPGSVTYVKSASYLLHANFMSNLKKLILSNSTFILEDDTGIPYDDIRKSKRFDIRLYGVYSKPVKNFPYLRMQQGILDAYARDSAAIPPLPFHVGYHWQTGKDLLILATKKDSVQ